MSPGDDLQAEIDGHRARTTFCFSKGTYELSDTIRTGKKFPTLDLRSGAVLDGQDGDFTGISGNGAPAGRSGTIIQGGVLQHFGSADAPAWVSSVILSSGWMVKGTEFKHNFNTGLSILGDNARVTNANVHHNGKYGIIATHPCLECSGPKGVVIQDSEIAFNNTRRLDPGYDAGGTKFSAGTDGLIVRRNEIHDNYGSGLWFDSFSLNARVYDNVIYDNYRWGIFWENSYGGADIHHNRLTGNGLGDGTSNAYNAQLVVANSDGSVGGIEIHDNTITGSAYPLSIIDGSSRGIRTKHVNVHDNVMTLRASTAQVGAFGTALFDSKARNRFDHNTYRVLDRRAAYWAWNGQTLAWAEWRSAGHDANGEVRKIT